MIGDRIKELRKAHMLTQAQMAEQTGINVNTLASYERNIREPNIEVISLLCGYFKVSSDYLLGLSPYQSKTHSKRIDSLFQGLPSELQNRLVELQVALLRAAETFTWAGYELDKDIFGELFRCLGDDVERCIKAYVNLIDGNTHETNWESSPNFFVDNFIHERAQMSQNIASVIDCIYKRGNIGSDSILINQNTGKVRKSLDEKTSDIIRSALMGESEGD